MDHFTKIVRYVPFGLDFISFSTYFTEQSRYITKPFVLSPLSPFPHWHGLFEVTGELIPRFSAAIVHLRTLAQ